MTTPSTADIYSKVRKPSFKIAIQVGLWIAWGSATVWGLVNYQGSKGIYLGFSAVFLLTLTASFKFRHSYGYTFVAALLWLGFWLKVTYHLINLSHPYIEPIGKFIDSKENWDLALTVGSAAAAGTLLSKVFADIFFRKSKKPKNQPKQFQAKTNWKFGPFLAVLALLVTSNLYFGIAIIGLGTATILPGYLNAFVTLMLMAGGGLAVWLSCIVWHRAVSGKKLTSALALLIFSATVISSTSLSRGMIVAFLLPILYALYKNRQIIAPALSRSAAAIIVFCCATAIASNFYLTTRLRSVFYQNPTPPASAVMLIAESNQSTSTANQASPAAPPSPLGNHIIQRFKELFNFSIDRWTGIEGVMAISAYDGKGYRLFIDAVLEKRASEGPSIYQRIAPMERPSGFRKNVVISSIPGGVGFLYYTGSILFVFLGSFFIVSIIQALESLISGLTRNPLICSSISYLMATLFVHQWGVPYHIIPMMTFSALLVGLIAIIQNDRIELIRRLIRSTHAFER